MQSRARRGLRTFLSVAELGTRPPGFDALCAGGKRDEEAPG